MIGSLPAQWSARSSLSALQEIARFWQQTGTRTCQSEAAEVAALGRRIVEDARKVGVRIGDNDNWQ